MPGTPRPPRHGATWRRSPDSWESWDGDAWDVASGLAAGYREFTRRIALMATAIRVGLAGDEAAAATWSLDDMGTPPNLADIADSLEVPAEQLDAHLAHWSGLQSNPSQ